MLKKSFLLLVVVAIFAACENTGSKTTVSDNEETVEMTVLKIEDFEAKAAELIDQNVKIIGTVDHVCKSGGKKMVLITDDGEESVHVFTNDEIGPFSTELEGDEVSVVATVSEFRIDEVYVDERIEHVKENHDADDPVGIEEIASLEKLRAEIQASKEGYLSDFSLDIVSYEVLNSVDVDLDDDEHGDMDDADNEEDDDNDDDGEEEEGC